MHKMHKKDLTCNLVMLQNYGDRLLQKQFSVRNWLEGRCFEDGMTMTTDTALLNIGVRGFV